MKCYLIIPVLFFLLIGCKKESSNPVEQTPTTPIVKILSPANNSTIIDSVTIDIAATDDKGIVKVEILIDNIVVKTFSVPPFKYLWYPSLLTDSSQHSIYAKAYDGDNNTSSSLVMTVTFRRSTLSNIPSSNVLFGKHIQPVFNVKCTSSGCHDDQTRAASLSLTSWTNSHVPGIINDYEPTTSRLVWAIEGQLGSNSMPPFGYPGLTQNQITGIKTWIKEGAKNN